MSNNKNRNENQTTVSPRDLLAMERTDLAIERTKLANERTLLAYIRTALTFFAGAAALIEVFSKSRKLEITAYIAIVFGIVLLVCGIYRFYQSKKAIKNMELIK